MTTNGGAYPRGLADPDYRNLYARWFQFAALLPIFRAHGTDVPREVWQLGGEESADYRNQLKYIDLRYRLMPFVYAAARAVSVEGASMIEALGMAFPEDRAVARADDAYMLGGTLLVRPVFEPMPAGAERQRVETLLPRHAGRWWYDFFTGEAHRGGERAMRDCDLTELPIYVRGGSILPLGEVKRSTGEGPDERLEIRIYAGADARFALYDDAGDGFGYAEGEYALVRMEWEDAASTLRVARREGAYDGMARVQRLTLRLFRPGQPPVERMAEYRGVPLECTF